MPKAIDITGKRFGRLVGSHYTGRTTSGGRVWYCRCDCGGSTETTVGYLKSGKTQSCGCYQKQMASEFGIRQRKPGAAFRRLFYGYKSNAQKSGIHFLLTEEQFKNLTSSNCEYCGAIPAGEKKTPGEIYIYNGIDRINSASGYIKENCVPACWTCNQMKSTFGRIKFLRAIERIYDHQHREMKI